MKFINKETGKLYNNRKEAKEDMGTNNYYKALNNCQFIFIDGDKYLTTEEFREKMKNENHK